jgi:hypothetical protein
VRQKEGAMGVLPPLDASENMIVPNEKVSRNGMKNGMEMGCLCIETVRNT